MSADAGSGAASAGEPGQPDHTDPTVLPGDDAGQDAVEAAAEAVEIDLDRLLVERDQFREIAQRLQADFENYKKRADRQVLDESDRQVGRVVASLLEVLDACELAVAHGVDGVEPIWSKLYGSLTKHGLEAMDAQGAPFDPAEHEAVVHEDGEGSPSVIEVLRTGYRWKGKVLRPAMVKVKG